MNDHSTVNVPDGFLLKVERQAMDIEQARLLLRTRAQHRYTSARRMGEQALLTRHKLVCPCCGQSFPPAAFRSLPGLPRKGRIPRNEIDAWADPQTRFYDDETAELTFRKVEVPKTFLCPSCGYLSEPHTRTNTVCIGVTRQKITVTCCAANFDLLFSSSDSGDGGGGPLSLPLTEQLTFNLRNGHTSLHILGTDGHVYYVRDITPGSKDWTRSTVYALLKMKPVCRKLLRTFASLYGAPLPFTREDTTPDSFLLMALFRGYTSRHFFDSIPYEFTSGIVDRSFRAIVRQLHNAAHLPDLYASSKLPQTKSIKRLFFSSQGLFFYLREAETLWKTVEDVNLLRSILEMDHVFEILGFLHQCPGAARFFRDYLRIKGAGSLLFWLEHRWRLLISYSAQYTAMSDASRKVQQREWQKTGLASQPHLPYSIPMKTGDRRIRDCTIDGYRFCWLGTRQEYRQAGHLLHNYLTHWEPDCNPVIVVKKGKECKAAIEMDGTVVLQALGQHNDPLALDLHLWRAFHKWLEKYSLAPPLDLDSFGELDFLL